MAQLKGKIEVEVKEMGSVKGMTTCKVCGRDFPLLAEEHYVVRDVEKKGVIPAINGQTEAEMYDAFDCPHCGCQNVMQGRKQGVCPCDFGICDECEEDDAEDISYSCCEDCKYATYSSHEEPCSKCKHCYVSMFEKESDDDE